MEATDDLGVVLIHGSELGSWVWDRVTPALEPPALAVDLPGRQADSHQRRSLRLADAIRAVVEDLGRWDDRNLVVVAHSFAGMLVPAVAASLPDRVAAAVWLAGTVPQPGRSWVDLQPLLQRLLLRVLYRAKPAGVASPEADNRRTLCHDLDADATAEVLERRVIEPPRFLLDPAPDVELPADVESHYVRLLDDRAVTADTAGAMIDRLGTTNVHELPGGHLPMLSRPKALAELLNRIAVRS